MGPSIQVDPAGDISRVSTAMALENNENFPQNKSSKAGADDLPRKVHLGKPESGSDNQKCSKGGYIQ